MSLLIANRHIPTTITLLDQLPLAGAASRARTRLITALTPNLSALQDAEYALVCEHAQLNLDGTPQVGHEGQITFTNTKAAQSFQQEHILLLDEQAKVNEAYAGHFHTLHQALSHSSQKFSGNDALVYDMLLTALENTLEAVMTEGGDDSGSTHHTQ